MKNYQKAKQEILNKISKLNHELERIQKAEGAYLAKYAINSESPVARNSLLDREVTSSSGDVSLEGALYWNSCTGSSVAQKEVCPDDIF